MNKAERATLEKAQQEAAVAKHRVNAAFNAAKPMDRESVSKANERGEWHFYRVVDAKNADVGSVYPVTVWHGVVYSGHVLPTAQHGGSGSRLNDYDKLFEYEAWAYSYAYDCAAQGCAERLARLWHKYQKCVAAHDADV
jgi:hypothetical protein